MIGHVYDNIKHTDNVIDTYVATCDKEIYDYIESIGGKSIMTSNNHKRASDRTAEAMYKIEEILGYKVDIVVMVQGDEPMVTNEMIKLSLEPFKDESVSVVNLMSAIESIKEFEDPNEPKVVVDKFNNALYFSREPIPSRKMGIEEVPMYKQVCIIPFRRDALIEFNKMDETSLENVESIDMNRLLQNGKKGKMVPVIGNPISVDTPSDLNRVKKKLSL